MSTIDEIQSLARIAQASTRLMELIHRVDVAVDPNEEIEHMQANLDHVRKTVSRET